MRSAIFVFFGFLATCSLAASPGFVEVASRNKDAHPGYSLGLRAAGHERVKFRLYLHQNEDGLEILDQIFHAVSDPDSKEYGNFLSKAEVDNLLHAHADAFEAVANWLAPWEDKMLIEKDRDSVTVTTTSKVVSEIFRVPFHQFTQKATGRSKVLAYGSVEVPESVAAHLDVLGGLTEVWHGRQPAAKHEGRTPKAKAAQDVDVDVTPDLLRDYYRVPKTETNTADNNLQAIAAFNDYFSQDALDHFNERFGISQKYPIDIMGVDCLNDDKVCDQVESDLDIQYITALGTDTKTLFHNQNDNWVLQFSQDAQNLDPLPLVFSISYGWAELKQCDIAYLPCITLGYNSTQYVRRTNIGFKALATMGVSIIVSDGDDGAQGVFPDGSNPIDPDRWCGGQEYTCYPKTSSKCTEILLKNYSVPDAPTCPWPVGSLAERCEFLYLGDFYQVADINVALQEANPDCNVDIFYDFDYGVHLYSECECDQLAPISHEGVVSMPFEYDPSYRLFYADFPTDSPYVTSMGATRFRSEDGFTVTEEVTASIVDGSIITTGGGFSAIFKRPKWQAPEIANWNKNASAAVKPPRGTYDVTKRGYPDLTLNGHNYQVFYSDDGSENCGTDNNPCKQGGVDGTSASAPAFAGIVSLLNGALLSAGKTSLGFLNPLLYRMSRNAPKAFRDITYGDNKCTRNFCMIHGYNATEGWDPVAGLGSIRYGAMKAYVMKVKGVTADEEVMAVA